MKSLIPEHDKHYMACSANFSTTLRNEILTTEMPYFFKQIILFKLFDSVFISYLCSNAKHAHPFNLKPGSPLFSLRGNQSCQHQFVITCWGWGFNFTIFLSWFLLFICDFFRTCATFVHDCQQLKDYGFNGSGIFHVVPVGSCKGFNVYCDMSTDDGGWLVSLFWKTKKSSK